MLMEMVMVFLHEKNVPITEDPPKEFQLEKVEIIPNDLIRDDDRRFFRGIDLSHKNLPFLTKNHFRDKKGRFCAPAFVLTPEENESIIDFSIKFGVSDDDSTLHELTKVEDCYLNEPINIYIDFPKGKYEKKENNFYWFFKHNSNPKVATLGVVHPGHTRIFLMKNGKRYDRERNLFAFPSSITLQELETMLNEMIFIRRELIFHKNFQKEKAYFNQEEIKKENFNNWKIALMYIKQCLEHIQPFLKKINDTPYARLKSCKKNKMYSQIRKMSPAIIEQYIKNKNRRTYRVDDYKSTVNIYEHQLLLCKLNELKRFIEEQEKQSRKNNTLEKNNIYNEMKQLMGNDGIFSNKDCTELLTDRWSSFVKKTKDTFENNKQKKIEEFNTAFSNKPLTDDIDNTNNTIQITFIKVKPELSIINNRMCICFTPIWDNYFGTTKISGCSIEIQNERSYLKWFKMESNDSISLLSFYKSIYEKSENNLQVNETIRVEFKGDFEIKKEDTASNGIPIYSLLLKSLKKMVVNNEEGIIVIKRTEAEEKLRNIYIDIELGREEESKFLDYHNVLSLNQLYEDNKDKTTKSLFNTVNDLIDKQLSLQIFKNVENIKRKWSLTQILTNDYRYHQVYKQLRLLDAMCDFSFSENKEKVYHNKIDQIYEYWILAKILEELVINQKWTSIDSGSNDYIKIFNDYFENSENIKTPIIKLKHDGNGNQHTFLMSIYYNTKLELSLQDKLTRPLSTYSHNTLELRPDYLFRIIDIGKDVNDNLHETEKVFILDAKYRDYNQMGGINCWLNSDLKEVCIDKYIVRPKNDLNIDIAAAFIVHSDLTNCITNPNKESGEYVTYNGNVDSRCVSLMEKNQFKEKQFGSFYLVPFAMETAEKSNIINQSNINLETFFTMLFEFYMNDWSECWHCGSQSVDVRLLYTKSHFSKYHMQCKECGAFWVKTHCKECHNKLIKHMKNYHVEENGQHWFVRCPSCGFEKKEEVQRYNNSAFNDSISSLETDNEENYYYSYQKDDNYWNTLDKELDNVQY